MMILKIINYQIKTEFLTKKITRRDETMRKRSGNSEREKNASINS